MSTLTDEIFSQLSRADVQQIGAQLGTGQAQTAGAIAAALPMILGAMGRNTAQPQGAEALLGALGRDHASGGGIGDILGAVLGGQQGRQTDGLGQLGHIFGGQLPRAETGLGQATGLGGDKAQMLLKILAPIVLAYLAKRMFGGAQQGPGNAQALGDILGQERAVQQQQGGLGGGLLGAVLDQDGDGQLGLDDLLKMGGSFLGGGR
ncbi:DUF937 domain-containing protein [Thermomonas sp.]|uniref:DUF937 domain-containing protein n=1 Tax=Thermomonas sp. TaxID=1971895 RepID=UPI0035B1DAD3